MTPRFPAWIAATAAALLIAAGCASSPPSRFYTLTGAAPTAKAQSDLAVAVGPVTIPAIVDRPQIVVTINDNEVWLDEFNRWAAPLSDAIGIVVAENLSAELGSPRVMLSSQATGNESDFHATIEVRRFESRPGIHALLDAVFSVRRVKDGVRLALDERGRMMSSPDFAQALARWRDGGRSDLAILIGGADGLDPALRDRADALLSFGPMVWPHMLVRVMIAEQLYRAASILAGAPYHRA